MAISCQEVISEMSPSHLEYGFHGGQILWGKFIEGLFYMGGTNDHISREKEFHKMHFPVI